MLDRHVSLETNTERRVQGLTAVLGLAIQRGSLAVLSAVNTFLAAATDAGSDWTSSGQSTSVLKSALVLLRQLAGFRIVDSFFLFSASPLSSQRHVDTVATTLSACGVDDAGAPRPNVECQPLARRLPSYCSVLSLPGNAFVVVHTPVGLYKVGTGVLGSVRGFVYASSRYAAGKSTTLFYYRDRIFVSCAPTFRTGTSGRSRSFLRIGSG